MLKDWNIIEEMRDEDDDGRPTCYSREYDGNIWWVTQFPDRWMAEVMVRTPGYRSEIIGVKDFRSPGAAARWVEQYHKEWLDNDYRE